MRLIITVITSFSREKKLSNYIVVLTHLQIFVNKWPNGKRTFFCLCFFYLYFCFSLNIYIVISWNCLDSERVWYSKIFIKNILRMKRIHSLDFSLHSKIEFLKHVCVFFVLFNSQFFLVNLKVIDFFWRWHFLYYNEEFKMKIYIKKTNSIL